MKATLAPRSLGRMRVLSSDQHLVELTRAAGMGVARRGMLPASSVRAPVNDAGEMGDGTGLPA